MENYSENATILIEKKTDSTDFNNLVEPFVSEKYKKTIQLIFIQQYHVTTL